MIGETHAMQGAWGDKVIGGRRSALSSVCLRSGLSSTKKCPFIGLPKEWSVIDEEVLSFQFVKRGSAVIPEVQVDALRGARMKGTILDGKGHGF